jgi:hypothetical protein
MHETPVFLKIFVSIQLVDSKEGTGFTLFLA